MPEDGLHITAARGLLVRTQCLLLRELQLFCHLPDILLMNQTEGTDNGERIMLQPQTRKHRGGRTLEGDIHQESYEDIIHVMAQGYLIETITHRKLEKSLPAVPRTEKATGLAGIGGFIKGTVKDMEPDAILCTEILQIRTIGLVGNVIHDDMCRLYLDMRLVDAGTLRQHSHQLKRILSATERYQYSVAILQKAIIYTSLVKALENLLF